MSVCLYVCAYSTDIYIYTHTAKSKDKNYLRSVMRGRALDRFYSFFLQDDGPFILPSIATVCIQELVK